MPADARVYDSERLARCYAQTRPPVHQAICARLFDAWPAALPLRAALDVGCGAGVSTAALVGRVAQVTGIDPFAPMLAQAQRRLPGARFVQATAEALPLPAASVDLVTAAGSLNYADTGRALAEIARVLHPGGRLAVYDFATGRVLPRGGPSDAAFQAFEHRFPWPGGYDMQIDALPYAVHGLALLSHERFGVELPMSAEVYRDYVMGETNVEAAIAAGLPEAEARQACATIFGPLFAASPRRVGFDAVLAVAARMQP